MRRPFFPLWQLLLALLFIEQAFVPCPAAPSSRPQPIPLTSAQEQAPEAELQTGIALTQRGQFGDAIPHFLAARGHVQDDYAASFNLALCYVGTSQFPDAIRILNGLRASGHGDANVENLLAQAYIGINRDHDAFAALERSTALAPSNEKLYLLVADAAADRRNYSLGLRVISLAVQNLPTSARLHYQRGYFLAMLDEFDSAKPEFDRAAVLAPKTEVAYLAAAQKSYFAGDMPAAIRSARTGIQQGHENYLLLTILGDALVRSGAGPCDIEFEEASAALNRAVQQRPNYVAAQIALGNLLLIGHRLEFAIPHLELARQLDPRNPSVYSHLAVAYREVHRQQDADAALATLARLNADEAARIHSAPGERKSIPGASGGADRPR